MSRVHDVTKAISCIIPFNYLLESIIHHLQWKLHELGHVQLESKRIKHFLHYDLLGISDCFTLLFSKGRYSMCTVAFELFSY